MIDDLKRLDALRTKGKFVITGSKENPLIATENGHYQIASVCGGNLYFLPNVAKQVDANAELIAYIFNHLPEIILGLE